MAASLPSVTKILQPKDSRILKTGDYVNASGETALNSDYLFEAKKLLDRWVVLSIVSWTTNDMF